MLERAHVWADLGLLENFYAETFGCGEAVHDDWLHSRQVGVGLLESDAGLQPREGFIAIISQMNVTAVPLHRQDYSAVIAIQEMKVLGKDADDLVSLSVDDDGPADQGGVGAELAAPVCVGEHGSGRGAGGVVLTAEGAAKRGSDAQERKSAIGDAQCSDLFGFFDTRDTDGIVLIGADVDETLILLTENEVSGGRDIQVFDVEARSSLPDSDEVFGARIGQGLEEDAFQDAENNGVGADSRCQRDQRDCGEHRGASQSAEDLSQLVPKFPHKTPPGRSDDVQRHVGVAPVSRYEIAGKKFLRRRPARAVNF